MNELLGSSTPHYFLYTPASNLGHVYISVGIQGDVVNDVEPVRRHPDVLHDFFVRAVRTAEGLEDFAIQGESKDLAASRSHARRGAPRDPGLPRSRSLASTRPPLNSKA